MQRRDFQVKHRPFSTNPLVIDTGALPDVEEITEDLMQWALDLLEEDELHAIRSGAGIEPWLRRPDAERIRHRLTRAVLAAAALRHDTAFDPASFSSVSAIAARAGVDRTQLLRDIGPRAQLLPLIVAAGFSVDGFLGPFRAFSVYEDSDRAGRESNAYGVHRAPGLAPLSRMMGITGVGVDTMVPVTAQPLVTGMRDDPALTGAEPERLKLGRHAARVSGSPPPSTPGEHLAAHLRVVNGARRVVERAAAHSPASARARILPDDVLNVGFPRWLVAPPLQVGPGTNRQRPISGRLLVPGLDPGMLRAAFEARMLALFWLASGARASLDAAEASSLIYTPRLLTGVPLVQALLELDAKRVPDMKEPDAAEIHFIAAHADAAGIELDPLVRYAFVPSGVQLTNTDPPVHVGIVLRQSIDRTVAWATTARLRAPQARAEAVLAAELQIRSLERAEVSNCIRRFFHDHHVHGMQPSSPQTRMALRTVTMLANLGGVGVNRARQVGRGPT